MNRDHLSVYFKVGTQKDVHNIINLPLSDQVVMFFLKDEIWKKMNFETYNKILKTFPEK